MLCLRLRFDLTSSFEMVWFGLEFYVFSLFFFFVGVLLGTDGSGFCRIWDTQTQDVVVLSCVGVLKYVCVCAKLKGIESGKLL